MGAWLGWTHKGMPDKRGHRRTSAQVQREGAKRIERKNQELMALREETLVKKEEVEALRDRVEQLELKKATLMQKLQHLESSRSDSSGSSSSSESSSEGWAECQVNNAFLEGAEQVPTLFQMTCLLVPGTMIGPGVAESKQMSGPSAHAAGVKREGWV